MRKIFVGTIFVLLAVMAAAGQEKRLSSSPREFRMFFAEFKSAVERSDKVHVAAMTRFPFQYGFDAGDEGTMSRTQFAQRFSDVFGKNPRKFFTERNPVFYRGDDGSYVISTEDAAHLVFFKTRGTFKFASYIVEP